IMSRYPGVTPAVQSATSFPCAVIEPEECAGREVAACDQEFHGRDREFEPASERALDPAGIQAAVDAGLVTWADVLDVLRSDMHIPEGAIEEWRAEGRDLATVVAEWLGREARAAP
ncbi:MAG: hypothetical protein ACR2M1_13725, partial [Gemmatimonadaceae bacterium]